MKYLFSFLDVRKITLMLSNRVKPIADSNQRTEIKKLKYTFLNSHIFSQNLWYNVI